MASVDAFRHARGRQSASSSKYKTHNVACFLNFLWKKRLGSREKRYFPTRVSQGCAGVGAVGATCPSLRFRSPDLSGAVVYMSERAFESMAYAREPTMAESLAAYTQQQEKPER